MHQGRPRVFPGLRHGTDKELLLIRLKQILQQPVSIGVPPFPVPYQQPGQMQTHLAT